MLYSFLDTYPNANLPQPIDDALIQIAFSALDRYVSNSSKTNVYSMIIEGMLRCGLLVLHWNSCFICVYVRFINSRV